jgi:rhodanese-like protein
MQPVAPLHEGLLTAGEVVRGLEAGATVIDVRDPEVFDAGHALGAVNVPGADAGAVARHLIAAAAVPAVGPLLGASPIGRSGAIELDRLADELATGAVLLVDVRDPLGLDLLGAA